MCATCWGWRQESQPASMWHWLIKLQHRPCLEHLTVVTKTRSLVAWNWDSVDLTSWSLVPKTQSLRGRTCINPHLPLSLLLVPLPMVYKTHSTNLSLLRGQQTGHLSPAYTLITLTKCGSPCMATVVKRPCLSLATQQPRALGRTSRSEPPFVPLKTGLTRPHVLQPCTTLCCRGDPTCPG